MCITHTYVMANDRRNQVVTLLSDNGIRSHLLGPVWLFFPGYG